MPGDVELAGYLLDLSTYSRVRAPLDAGVFGQDTKTAEIEAGCALLTSLLLHGP